jgi:large subunit ribosomal protein L25
VKIELKGVPAAIGHGHILQQPLHDLEIECPALAIPDAIRVNIADLKPQEPIHVSDLKLPEGIKAMNAPDLVVVQLAAVAAEAEAPAAAAAVEPGLAEAAEPEIVGRRVAKDEEGEE